MTIRSSEMMFYYNSEYTWYINKRLIQFQNYKYYFEVSIVVLKILPTSMVPVPVVLFTVVSQSVS